ncbi:unnamed protein product [Polarella glacialis]|uniref:EF-hand domain-containing protein n=1 Tax=Polarella glacialis TaxID=89957 RepID=A0A813HLQ2_POLGL|nr:unnamed protein product [Polarella glacialis]
MGGISTATRPTNQGLSDFIRSESSSDARETTHDCDYWRNSMDQVLESNAADVFLGIIIGLDVYASCVDIDSRAQSESTPSWAATVSNLCFTIYLLEFTLRVFIKRTQIFDSKWAVLDFIICFTGLLEVVLNASGISIVQVGMMRLLRLARIMRLTRLFRKFAFLRELRKLMLMAASCCKTLLWSFIFCFIVMTVWAMASVELIHPLVVQMTAEGHFEDCPYCQNALSSVMRANLLLFQTVIAGDSWGRLATPVIEAHPWTAIIFMGSQLTVVFGVLNLVVAVVVDTFAAQREKDVVEFAQDMDADQDDDKKFLRRIFTKIDADGSGELSIEELMHGARTIPEFQSRLRVMDIDEGDLTQFFQMLDGDDSGTVEPEEFINALSRWVHDSKTANRFVKYNVMRSMIQQEELRDLLVDKIEKLETNLRHKLETKTGVKKEKHIPKGPKQGQLSVGPNAGGASLVRPPRSLEESVMITTERALRAATDTITDSLLEAADQALQRSIKEVRQTLLDVSEPLHDVPYASKMVDPGARAASRPAAMVAAAPDVPPMPPSVPGVLAAEELGAGASSELEARQAGRSLWRIDSIKLAKDGGLWDPSVDQLEGAMPQEVSLQLDGDTTRTSMWSSENHEQIFV